MIRVLGGFGLFFLQYNPRIPDLTLRFVRLEVPLGFAHSLYPVYFLLVWTVQIAEFWIILCYP